MNQNEFQAARRNLRDLGLLRVSNAKGFATVTFELVISSAVLWMLLALGPAHAGFWVLELIAGALVFHWFVVVHECGHRTLFRRKSINSMVGHIASLICLIPYLPWREIHWQHHRWVGVVDLDPTQAHLLELQNFGAFKTTMFRVFWRLWLPVPFARFIFEVFWGYPLHRWRENDIGNALKGMGSIAVIVAFHGLVIGKFGAGAWAVVYLPMLIVFYFIIENVTLPQHSELFPHLSEHHPHPTPLARQDVITRSTHLPDILSSVLTLNFNRHTEHHLFVGAPWYSLNRVREVLLESGYRIPHEVPFLSFMSKLRGRDPVEIYRDALPSPKARK